MERLHNIIERAEIVEMIGIDICDDADGGVELQERIDIFAAREDRAGKGGIAAAFAALSTSCMKMCGRYSRPPSETISLSSAICCNFCSTSARLTCI